VSLQFSILKVLAGQPDGRATVRDLNRYITLLICPEWTARMKRLRDRTVVVAPFWERGDLYLPEIPSRGSGWNRRFAFLSRHNPGLLA
jgi:hypothetical protein